MRSSRVVGLALLALLLVAAQGIGFAAFSVLIQGEEMNLTSDMEIGEAPDAFGGKYIHVPTGVNTRSPVAQATYQVQIPADGTYKLWARIYGPHGDADAMYAWIDDNPPARFFPPNTEEWYWIEVATYNLSAGAHVVKVGHGEVQARIDALYLTDGSEAPPESLGFSVLIEAETLRLTDALQIASDPSASNGRYIFASGGISTRSPVAEGEGTVQIPSEGTYRVWVRIFGPDGDSDAMYVWFDDEAPRRFYPPTPGDWYWVDVGDFQLTAGAHVLKVGKGEVNARIDAIFISDDPANAPQ